MKTAARLALRPMLLGSVIAVMVWFAAFPTLATAQGSQGQDAVYNSSNGIVGSSSFIDAGMFAGTTFCSKIYNVLTSINPPYPSAGAVIDARGLPGFHPAHKHDLRGRHDSLEQRDNLPEQALDHPAARRDHRHSRYVGVTE